MDANTQQVSGYYAWDFPGKPLVYLSLNVVDRMSIDIQRGLGSIPKRGAEVGGVLLGSVETPSSENGNRTVIRVDDFEPVTCEYARGPSFLLSDAERAKLEDIVEKARPSAKLYSVGSYRSHTRDGALMPGDEDRDLFRKYFRDPNCSIMLLVHPFATKVSTSGIFVGENGGLPLEVPVEFPFRRREMTGEEAPPRRPIQERFDRQERQERPRRTQEEEAKPSVPLSPPPEVKKEPLAEAPPQYNLPLPAPELVLPPKKHGLVWLPFCFLFLLLGLALGYQAAQTFSPKGNGTGAKAFLLNLTAGRNGNTLTVRWDRDSPAVQAAERGVLEIVDGGFSKPVPLDSAHLREGTVVYQNTTADVMFRLVVYMTANATVTETVEWLQ